MINIGITGANGYLGEYLIRALLNSVNIQIKAFAHHKKPSDILSENIQYIYGDIRDEHKQNEFLDGLDVVVHLAAKLGEGSWKEFQSINVTATENLLTKSTKYKIKRFIYISTIEVYGFFKGEFIDENQHIELCGHFYSDSKIQGERLVKNICSSEHIEWIILRPGMVFGEGSKFWYERLYKQARQSLIPLVDAGDGLVYPVNIHDLVLFIQRLIFNPLIKNQIYNVCYPEKVRWRDIVNYYSNIFEIEAGTTLPKWLLFSRILTKTLKSRSRSKEYEVYTRKSIIRSDKITKNLQCVYKYNFYQTMEQGRKWMDAKNDDL